MVIITTMGIDLIVKSTVDDTPYEKDWHKKDLKYRWALIEWAAVFDLIGFNINLLYGQNICRFWAIEHIKEIHEALVELRDLKETPATIAMEGEEYWIEVVVPRMKKRDKLLPDLATLIADFTEFVENKCIIIVS